MKLLHNKTRWQWASPQGQGVASALPHQSMCFFESSRSWSSVDKTATTEVVTAGEEMTRYDQRLQPGSRETGHGLMFQPIVLNIS